MLEILLVWLLCKGNATKAKARGRSGGWAVGYTIILWLGMEFLGAVIGTVCYLGYVTYVIALLFAGIGGLISWLITIRDDPIKQEEIFKQPSNPVIQEETVKQPDSTVEKEINEPDGIVEQEIEPPDSIVEQVVEPPDDTTV